MEVDEALTKLGTCGRWQIIYYTVISLAAMFPAGWHMVAIVYIGYTPDHHCKIPIGALINESIPSENGVYSSCRMYSDVNTRNETIACTNGWQYMGDDGPTIVTEWDLVCDRSYLAHTPQTTLVFGVMFGAMLFTALSDYLGRKPVMLFSLSAMAVVGSVNAIVTNVYLFYFLRFLTGALQQGILLPGFVMICELFSARHRSFAGIITENFWAVGWCLFPLFAYLFRNWRYLQLFISLSCLLTVPLFWLLPESVPWLCANGRTDEAEKIIGKAARMNKITMPDKILLHQSAANTVSGSGSGTVEESEDKNGIENCSKVCLPLVKRRNKSVKEVHFRYTIIDLIKHPRLRLYSIVMSFLFMVVTLVYYGLTLSTSTLAGDRYFNAFLSALVEFPAYTSSYFVINRFGRRWPLVIYHCITGVSLILTYFLPLTTASGVSLQPLIITLNMLGKFGITASFGIIFLYVPEMFPTTLRNQALGIASLYGRIGNLSATFTSYLIEKAPWVPGPLFGTFSILGGLLVLLLPETLNRPLPQTIEEIDAWYGKPLADEISFRKIESDDDVL